MLESKVSKASYQARNFDAEVQAYLNPPSNLAGLSLAAEQRGAVEKTSAQQKMEAKARIHRRLRSYSAQWAEVNSLGGTLEGKCNPVCQAQRAWEAVQRALREAARLAMLAQQRAAREAEAARIALAERRRREEQERAAAEAARIAEEQRH